MADKRRKTVSVSFTDDGNANLSFHTAPDDAGNQSVAEVVALTPEQIHDGLFSAFALRGVINTFSNIYNRIENPSASDLRREYDKFIATVADGTWTPGRTMADSEPDDLMLALAEVTGQPVHLIQNKLEDMLAEVVKNPDGTDKADKAGRKVHVHSKRKLYAALEASDPRVKSALSKIVAERAKRLAADAKTAKATGPSLADMFGSPAEVQAAN